MMLWSRISIAQSSLEFNRNEFDLAVRNNWDHKRRWRTTTKLGFELNEDNGSGYFDYKRYYVAQQLRFQTGVDAGAPAAAGAGGGGLVQAAAALPGHHRHPVIGQAGDQVRDRDDDGSRQRHRS
jgi:hypothetical protein